MWLVRNVDKYFVALEETRIHMEKLGVDGGRVSVTGIPIDPAFAVPKDKAAMRSKYGLAPELTTILISAGGFGVGPIENMMNALKELKHPAQVVMICGKNQELQQSLEEWTRGLPAGGVRFHIVGYTTEMDQYMAAADLLVGKPGGLTTSEALARGLVMVIVNPIPGQEERNSDHLLEEGAAIRCNNLPALAYKIDKLLDDAPRLEAMRRNVARLARPDAARTIVRELVAMTSP
jgi:processive 1,2-diacylglycerol beta-glucosyltransferase